jgi:hypothetical protein
VAVLFPRVFPAAAILLAFAACTQPSPQSTAAPSAVPARHVALRPHQSKTAVVSLPATPLPRSTPRPVAKPTPVLRSPSAAPRIFNVDIASRVHSGQRVTGHVTTSSNVASVEVRIATYSIVMQKTGVGAFAIDYSIANVPFFFRGTYTMHVIARNTAGDRDERTIPLTIE